VRLLARPAGTGSNWEGLRVEMEEKRFITGASGARGQKISGHCGATRIINLFKEETAQKNFLEGRRKVEKTHREDVKFRRGVVGGVTRGWGGCPHTWRGVRS